MYLLNNFFFKFFGFKLIGIKIKIVFVLKSFYFYVTQLKLLSRKLCDHLEFIMLQLQKTYTV